MAARSQQTHAKRARELAVKERRERKRARKAEAAALRATGGETPGVEGGGVAPAPDRSAEPAASEWIQ